jgi:hypothetical protein
MFSDSNLIRIAEIIGRPLTDPSFAIYAIARLSLYEKQVELLDELGERFGISHRDLDVEEYAEALFDALSKLEAKEEARKLRTALLLVPAHVRKELARELPELADCYSATNLLDDLDVFAANARRVEDCDA